MSSLRPSRRSWSGWIQVSSRLLSPRRTAGPSGMPAPARRPLRISSIERVAFLLHPPPLGLRHGGPRVGLAALRGEDIGIVRPLRVRGVEALRVGGIAQLHLRRQNERRALAIIDPGALLRDDADRAEEVLGEHAFLGAGAGRGEERRGREERRTAREVENVHGTPPVSFLHSPEWTG